MSGFIDFLSNPQVHDTVLYTMIITAFFGAIRRIKDPKNWWQVIWNFLYDWGTGFWSMKTGQPVHPVDPQQPVGPAQTK